MKQQWRAWNNLQAVPYAAAFALMVAAGLISGTVADDAPADSANEGLVGIFPEEVPIGLTVDDFAALDGNWEQWGAETAELVESFYSSPGSLEEQRTKLAQLRSKDRVMERALDDPRYRSLYGPLTTLHGRLHRRLDLADAILATLELDPEAGKQERIAAAADDVAGAVTAVERQMRRIPNGWAWIEFIMASELRNDVENGGREVAARVHRKLQTAAESDDESVRTFATRPAFTELRQSLGRYLSAVDAPTEDVSGQLREELGNLVHALEEQAMNPSLESTRAVREAYSAIRRIAPDGGQIMTDVLRKHYFNYNTRLIVSESFLSRFVADTRRDAGPVRDFILGAAVSGSQTTDSTVGLDLRPSSNSIRFAITLTGVSRSNTVGVRDKANIYTSGYHRFFATKEADFNGDRFATFPATISVDANNTTTGANVDVPLFRGIARNIAINEAAKKRPQSEAIAASRVRDRVLPQFNGEVNSTFADASNRIQNGLNARLREAGLFPDARTYQSTSTHARINARLMGPEKLGGSDPALVPVPTSGATVMLHESVLNNAADELGFAGKEMTDDEVRARVEEFLSQIVGRDVNIPDRNAPEATDEDVPNVFLFDETDPVRFRVDDDTVFLIIRAAFKRQGSDDPPIPEKEITVPLHFTAEGDQVLITRDNVQVDMVERVGIAEHIGQAGVIRKKIESGLPERQADGTLEIKSDTGKIVRATIQSVTALDGWVSINVR